MSTTASQPTTVSVTMTNNNRQVVRDHEGVLRYAPGVPSSSPSFRPDLDREVQETLITAHKETQQLRAKTQLGAEVSRQRPSSEEDIKWTTKAILVEACFYRGKLNAVLLEKQKWQQQHDEQQNSAEGNPEPLFDGKCIEKCQSQATTTSSLARLVHTASYGLQEIGSPKLTSLLLSDLDQLFDWFLPKAEPDHFQQVSHEGEEEGQQQDHREEKGCGVDVEALNKAYGEARAQLSSLRLWQR